MKILTINTRYIGGGGAAYIANMLHREINKIDGFSSEFLYGRGIDGDYNSKRIIYPKMDYLSALSYRFTSRELNFNKDIEEDIKKCDIVHLHNIHGYYLDYKRLFKILKKYNKKIVWTLHDMWPLTGRCAYSFGCEKWKKNCGSCKNKKSYPSSLIDTSEKELKLKRKFIGDIDKDNMVIVTPSEWLASICKQSYLNKFEIKAIPNGIQHNKITKSKKGLKNKYKLPLNKKIVLFVAADTCDERKGIKYILDIIPKCRDHIFISIGKKIDKIKFDNFIQLGYISNRDRINEVYSMADVFMITSIDDNFPTTVLESLANSTPIIGFNQGGIPEQVDKNTGIIVNDISSKELEKELLLLLKNEERLQLYSKEARKRFLEKYTIELFVKSYIDVYKELGENI